MFLPCVAMPFSRILRAGLFLLFQAVTGHLNRNYAQYNTGQLSLSPAFLFGKRAGIFSFVNFNIHIILNLIK